MSNIQKACENYKSLLNKEYYFVLGRKNKTVNIKLKFTKYEFYHLTGLHKLIDIELLNGQNSKKVFDNTLNGVITQDLCQKSKNYNQVDERISFIENLEDFFDSNKTVFKYDNKVNSFSMIEADYLLKNETHTKNFYVFISREHDNSDVYFCRSAFPRDKSETDYAMGHTSYTLLYKEKIDLLTNERQVLYTHPPYKKELEQNTTQSKPQQNDNIKQIKFDSPAPQNVVHSSSGAATAVMTKPNPFKNIFEKIKSSIKNFFRLQDKPTEQPSLPLNTASKTDNITDKTQSDTDIKAFSENNFSKELKLLNEARSALANKDIQKNEYTKALIFYIKSLDSEEKTEEAIKTLESLSSELPPNEKNFIKNEIYNVSYYLIEKYRPNEKSWLETLRNAKTADKAEMSKEQGISEKENHISKNDCIR